MRFIFYFVAWLALGYAVGKVYDFLSLALVHIH